MEHLPENSRRLLLFWPFFGTFAGDFSPAFVAVLVVFWNILRKIPGVCGLGACVSPQLRAYFLVFVYLCGA